MTLSPIELAQEAFEWVNSDHDDNDIFKTELEVLSTLEMDINTKVASDILDENYTTHFKYRDPIHNLEKAFKDPQLIKQGPDYMASVIAAELYEERKDYKQLTIMRQTTSTDLGFFMTN